VPTDTMKNFVLSSALEFGGSSLEGLLDFLARRFLESYPSMESVMLSGTELPFVNATVPSAAGFAGSQVLFGRANDDRAVASLTRGTASGITDHRCGRTGLQLIKLTGSSFESFAADRYTTLKEVRDRPLFIYVDVYWRYVDPAAAFGTDTYVPSEQVRDLIQTVFHEFVSKSIQHLVYEMGQRLLARFAQLIEVSFEAQNRLWDTAFTSSDDPARRVYCDPRPPYGSIGLTLRRDDG